MPYTPPWRRPCDCRCPIHYRRLRTTYNEPQCACTITCDSQPMTLLAEQWACALFLDERHDLWFVNRIGRASWEWENAGLVDPRHEMYRAANQISHLLRTAAHTLITADE